MKLRLLTTFCTFSLALPSFCQSPKFRHEVIDDKIQIGYGLAVADVQGDGKPDIVLADKGEIVWYENPTWQKHVIAKNLTAKDHVCVAARDIDGDGKCEIAVGAEWNPGDTVNSGAVIYLVPPEDRRQAWTPIRLHAEPTTHRMRWVKVGAMDFRLVVVPLHGRGNVKAQGEPVKVMSYARPSDPHQPWNTEVIDASYHATHNFDVVPVIGKESEDLLLGGAEGWKRLSYVPTGSWKTEDEHVIAAKADSLTGVGEIRLGQGSKQAFVATVEPMHGNELAVYEKDGSTWKRQSLTAALVDGHALGTGRLLNRADDQIVVGWRANQNKLARVGIELWSRRANAPEIWESQVIDSQQMACEDLVIADLNGDGKPEIIAAGRRTKNVKVYWNESP